LPPGWLVGRCGWAGGAGRGGRFEPGGNGAVVDYNAYGNGGGELFRGLRYPDLARQFGWDAHSLRVEWNQVFNEPIAPPSGDPRYWSGIVGFQIPKEWQFNHPLLTPRAGPPKSGLIDAGTVLPNLTGPYLGAAPDLGANEAGLGTPWYGPRTWDAEARIIYGLPERWKKVPLPSAASYAAIGCPTATEGVLLASEKPATYALLRPERLDGEERWVRARTVAADGRSAATPVLEFQDGFYVRRYIDSRSARLVAARVEPTGVLHVVAGCAAADLPKTRLALFQFIRSLER
jgi:hypothetical protein